ncbi:MAG: hypothetical protein FWJ73_05400 [Limnochordales bacterium]
MERKICPHCGKPNYSSLSYTEVWTCAYCGKDFLAVEGEEQGRPFPPHARFRPAGPAGETLRRSSSNSGEGPERDA